MALKQRGLQPNGLLYPLSDIDRLFADRTLHGVVICTPTSTHFELAEKAIKAGKAVLLEKPGKIIDAIFFRKDHTSVQNLTN